MFRNNFNPLYRSAKLNPCLMNSTTRLSMLRAARSMPKRDFGGRSMFKFSFPKRNFNKRIDRGIEELVSKLPGGNIGIFFVGVNTFFYFIYLIWPRDIMHKFLNNFTISQYNLSRGRLHTLLLSHFTHMGFLSYAIDSAIMYLFCQNLSYMFGPVYIAKLAFLGMMIGSLFLMFQHSGSGMQRPY